MQLALELIEIAAIGLHLFRLAQLELIVVARRPAVGDVDEQQLGAGQPRERADVIDDRAIGPGVLDGDEDASIHQAFHPRSA